MHPGSSADGFKRAVRTAALDALREAGLGLGALTGVSVHVEIRAGMPRPLSHWLARDPARGLRTGAPAAWHHTGKPDVDNVAKAVLDALGPWPRRAAPILWQDDSCVASLRVQREWASGAPYCVVSVAPIPIHGLPPGTP
jgi:Holliday junction resolvase RusA-like endonuclease